MLELILVTFIVAASAIDSSINTAFQVSWLIDSRRAQLFSWQALACLP